MKCLTCGEFIYRGRKFNSRKETDQEQKYLNIQIFQFHIKCTRCSAEIIFRTDPKNNDYAMVKGAMRNMEPWKNRDEADESLEQRLDRLEREEAEGEGEEDKNAMEELEAKNADARREMAAADALDEIRHRNARIARSEKDGVDFVDSVVRVEDEERMQQEREDEEEAKKAFAAAKERVAAATEAESAPAPAAPSRIAASATANADTAAMPPPSFKRVVKKKKDYGALLGIKKL